MRIRCFNFKIVHDFRVCFVSPFSLGPSEPMASLSSSLAGCLHSQVGAGSFSAAAVQPRLAVNSADFDNRQLGRVSDDTSASGLHAYDAFPLTSIER